MPSSSTFHTRLPTLRLAAVLPLGLGAVAGVSCVHDATPRPFFKSLSLLPKPATPGALLRQARDSLGQA